MTEHNFLEALDAYLSSCDSPDTCMMLSDLDGFLHGVICSPVTIPSEEWLPLAIGAAPETVPSWVIDEITDLYIGIAQDLAYKPPIVEPVFWETIEGQVIAMDWCEGFMQAVSLRPNEWLRLTAGGRDQHLLAPIVAHMFDANGNSALGIPQEKLDEVLAEAAKNIPDSVAAIFCYWR